MESISPQVTDHLDLWTSAIARKSSAGRGRSTKFSLHGIDKLRALILDLAVRGKLVPQDPADEPASELLRRVEAEKELLASKGVLRRIKPSSTDVMETPRYEIPQSWKWVRLPDIYYPLSVGSNKLLSSDIADSGDWPVVDQGQRFVAGYTHNRELLIEIPGPVIVFGDHTKQTKFIDFDFVAGADGVKILRPICLNERFFHLQLSGYELETRGYARHFSILNKRHFAVPPLAEQHRIVTKVDELMVLCDRLETVTYEAIEARQLLVTELLATLTTSRDAGELADNWARIEAHFDTLFATEDSVDQLKQTILQLAVMGRLVPQDPKDEPASELLKRIKFAKTVSHERENLRVRLPFADERGKGLGFVPPIGWATASFDDVFVMVSGVTKGQKIAPSDAVELPYLRVANVQRGFLDLTEIKSISVKSSDASRYRLRRNDILMTEGGDWDKVGRAAIWSCEIDECIHQNHVFRIRCPSDDIQPEWVIAFVNSAFGREYFQDASKQTTNLASINMTQLRLCPLPVPPLAEQHRIMAKLKGLLELCELMKFRIADANSFKIEIADAVAAKAVG